MKELHNSLEYIPKYFRVLTKPDARNLSDLLPMVLWPTQKFYIENRTHRDIVLKNRQTGMSTGILADNAHILFTQPYERQVIITHDDETSEFLLQTIGRFHRNLPDELKPQTDWHSGHRIRFPKLDSYIYIDSAKSESIGIGHGLTRAHLSEVAKWPARKENQLFADISQTVPEGGYMTIESTPMGRGRLFYRLYDAAKRNDINYKAFFFPWWWDVTCTREVKDALIFTTEEQQLINNFKLRPDQIAFRREKIRELGDLFYQEYPENDIDCWLSSEISVFDGVAIRKYMQQILPGKQEGNITIWKDVIGGEKYVIGVDPAGGLEKGDYSVAAVIRVKTNEYVARLRGKVPPDLFAQEIMRLGRRYNDAEIGVERIMHGHTVLKILLDNNYSNIYFREEYDGFGRITNEPGWVTSSKTKGLMVDTLASELRAGDIILWSENFLQEASEYVWEGQKTKKAPGGFDDELDAVMIAVQIRESIPVFTSNSAETVRSYVRL